MKALLSSLAIALVACSSSSGGTTGFTSTAGSNGSGSGGTTGSSSNGSSSGTTSGGSCAAALCNGTCCASGDQCIADACCPAAQSCGSTCCSAGAECVKDTAGNQACAVTCQTSSDCTGAATPCCEPTTTNGVFSGSGVCEAAPTTANPYDCLCGITSECGFFTSATPECIPAVNSSGILTGPYICGNDDGASHDGCKGPLTVCSVGNQYCSTDSKANEFCSIECTSDSLCGNPGVACCNATCGSSMCCGLCAD